MNNNIFILNQHNYVLGGLINAEVDRMVISVGKDSDIYEICLNNDKKISLSKRYHLFIGQKDKKALNISIKDVKVGDIILSLSQKKYKVIEKTLRKGTEILIPRTLFSLDDILVST